MAATRRKGTPTYAFTNPHPNGIISHDDCAYRAISIATGKDWLTVYDELTALVSDDELNRAVCDSFARVCATCKPIVQEQLNELMKGMAQL